MDPSAERILGRYALCAEIAHGGMATVHLGRLLGPVGFARTVAIKRLHPQFAKDPEFAAMFLDEARLAARVHHPNVVDTLDVVAVSGELFLVMEYIHGASIAQLMRIASASQKNVSPHVVASIMCGILHGLHAAHEAKSDRGVPLNIVHRDVSPQNILVDSDGLARVLDFGIAHAAVRTQATQDGTIKGKWAYIAPEQLRGELVTRQADIFSAGIIVWELLTGARLFTGDTQLTLMRRVLEGPIVPPSNLNSALPRQADAVLARALARNTQERYTTAQEFADALEDALGLASPREVSRWVSGLALDELRERARLITEIEGNTSPSSKPPAFTLSPPTPAAVPSKLRAGRQPAREKPKQVPPPASREGASTQGPRLGAEEQASEEPSPASDSIPIDIEPSCLSEEEGEKKIEISSHTALLSTIDLNRHSEEPTRLSLLRKRRALLGVLIALVSAVVVMGIALLRAGGSSTSTEEKSVAARTEPSFPAQAAKGAPVLEPPGPSEAAPPVLKIDPAVPASVLVPATQPSARPTGDEGSGSASSITASESNRHKGGVVPSISAASGASTGSRSGATSAGKGGCDPPYQYDRNGIRHFKPECL